MGAEKCAPYGICIEEACEDYALHNPLAAGDCEKCRPDGMNDCADLNRWFCGIDSSCTWNSGAQCNTHGLRTWSGDDGGEGKITYVMAASGASGCDGIGGGCRAEQIL